MEKVPETYNSSQIFLKEGAYTDGEGLLLCL